MRLFSLFAMMLVGCSSSTQIAICDKAALTLDGGARAIPIAYQVNAITQPTAQKMLDGVKVGADGVQVQTDLLAANPATTQPTALTDSLAQLTVDLNAIVNGSPILTAKRNAKLGEKVKLGQVAPALTAIELLVLIYPQAEQLIASLLANNSVTLAQLQSDAAKLNADIGTAQTTINGPQSPAP